VSLVQNPFQQVYYTLDNTEPDETSSLFNFPITIDSTSTLRLRAYRSGYIPSMTFSYTYFINYNSSIPVLSMVTDPDNLFGASGIYSYPTNGLEKPVHIEYYEANGSQGFSIDAGMKIHAPDTKPQKAFRFYARDQYGDSEINYQIFKDKNINVFKRLVLRNAGNDGIQVSTNRTNLRDPLVNIASGKINTTVGYASSNSVNVFINGEYWGMYNLRERIDKYYIEENYGYPNDQPMDLLERAFGYPSNRNAIEGSWTDAYNLEFYWDTNDLNIQANWDYVTDKIDVQNFADYWIIECYFGNFDWLTNNIKFWRPLNPIGKFKYILWDVDHGLGLPYLTYGDPEWNTLYWATSSDMAGRPDYGQNTRVIRGLLTNNDFKEHFIIRYADLLNSYLSVNELLETIDSVYNYVYPEMQNQINRWGSSSMVQWENSVQTTRNYAINRKDYVRDHIRQKFNLDTLINLSLNVFPADAGYIDLNTITVTEFPWSGLYYRGMSNKLTAIAKPGYEFMGWQNTIIDSAFIDVITVGDTGLVAIFQPTVVVDTSIVINEINYNSAVFWDTKDWIELYNPASVNIDLSDWVFFDEDNNHSFIFPTGTVIDSYDYLVLSEDTSSLKMFFPNLNKVIGDFNFGLSNSGELIRLYDNYGFLVDTVYYMDGFPWPVEPDGDGPTLVLIDPILDNALYSSWVFSSNPYGSPGYPDTVDMTGFLVNSSIKINFDIYPNPCNYFTVIYLNNPIRQNVIIKISDIEGNVIEEIVNRNFDIGNYKFSVNVKSGLTNLLKPGIYLIFLESESEVFVKKLLII
ncbi:MAG: CotH kinase family protein, partial [Bacteroidota bacterium]